MVKVAAIDCGSNSTRLLIADVSSGELVSIFKTHKVTKTSEGLEGSNEISNDAKNRLIKALREYQKKINLEKMSTKPINRAGCLLIIKNNITDTRNDMILDVY